MFGNVWQAEKQATQAATELVADLNERNSNNQLDDKLMIWSHLNLVEEGPYSACQRRLENSRLSCLLALASSHAGLVPIDRVSMILVLAHLHSQPTSSLTQ